jgi:hypothetical protein
MAVPVQLEIFMKDLTKAGLQSVGKNVDDVENQTLKLISALKQVISEQKKQLEVNKIAGLSYTQEVANIQALTGQVRGLEAGLNSLKKTKEEAAKTPSIDIDTEAVTRKTNNLKMQFSQVARELPSLAMGPQMFILAISNNLPMLADAIADVRKQNELLAASGKKGVPVWKQLGKALLSPQTALIALISLGIVYGKVIGQWIKKTFSFSDSLETLSESQKRYQEALNKGNAEAQNSITRLRVLYNAATDEAESTETRKKAIVALKKEYPDYFNKMSDENIMLGKSADAYERLTVSILAASRARASMKFLDENNEKIISLEQKITQEYVKRDAAQKELDKRIEKRNSIDREQNPDLYSGAQMMVGAASGRVDEIDKVIAEYRNRIYQLQKHNKEIELGIDVAALTTDFSGGSGGTGKKEKTDYASQLADARVKAQQTTEKLRLQIMVEGIAKRKALARQEYDEQLADIDKQERDTIAKMDKARKQGENIPQSQYDAVRQKSQEQRILVQQLYNDQLLQIDKEYNDKVTQSFIDYNKQYGTYQEKRLAIAMDYARKIAAAETEGDEYKKKALEQERKESLSALVFSELKDSIDWEVVFGNLSKVSKQELQKVKLQLKQFKQSPEYKNMTVEQQKIVNEAISSIQENIIEQGGILGDLPEQLKELASAQNELEDAQKEYNDALANGTEVEIEAARKKKTQATQNVINSQSNVNLSAEKAQNNISTVIDSISNLGEAGASLSSFGNSIGTLIDVFSESEHKIGGIVGAILGLLDQLGQKGIMGVADGILSNVWNLAGHMWDTIGSLFGVKGLGGIFYGADYSGYDNMKNQYETLIDIWDSLISKKQQYIDIDYGIEAQKAAEEAKKLVDVQIERQRQLMEALSGSGASIGSHSLGYRVNDRMSSSDWARLSELTGKNIRGFGDVINLDADVIGKVLQDEKFVSVLTAVNSEFVTYIQNIDKYSEQLKEIADQEKEAFTGVSFDEFKGSFNSLISDLDTTSQDFAENFEKYLQNAIFSSLIASKYKQQIQDLYDMWSTDAKSGNKLTEDEANVLRKKYQDIINDMLAEREQIMKDFGWSSSADSGSSQSPSSGALTTMSQDSISTFEGIGRNMQTHLANTDKFVQEIRNTQKQDSQTLATIAGHTAHLVEIHDILSDMKLNGIQLK